MEQKSLIVEKAIGLSGLNHSKMGRAGDTYLRYIRALVAILNLDKIVQPWPESNMGPFGSQADAQFTEPNQIGLCFCLLYSFSCPMS